VLEKAYASWKDGGSDLPDYQKIWGGDCLDALQELTGWTGHRVAAQDATQDLAVRCDASGKLNLPTMAWTPGTGNFSSVNIEAAHAYAFLGIVQSDGGSYVILRNPKGERDDLDPDLAPREVLPEGWLSVYDGDRGVIIVKVDDFAEWFEGVATLDRPPEQSPAPA